MTQADDPLARLAAAALDAARRAGATEADAVVTSGEALSVDVRDGVLERAERAGGIELGLRVLIGGRQACVAISDVSPERLPDMAERAVAMAREAPVDDSAGLPDAAELGRACDPAALELTDGLPPPSPETLLDLALRAEAGARSVAGVRMVEAAGAAASHRRIWLANTLGFSEGYCRSSHSLSAVAITGEGTAMERDWASEGRVFASDLPSPESIGRLAGERAVARAGARKPPTGSFPILFDQRVASSLIGHLLSAVNGTSIARGSSWLRDALDQPVLPVGFDLTEDPLLPRHPASRPFDGEGLATRPRRIVADGVLQGWTLDVATGRRLGMPSTASAVRGTSAPPAPGVSNVVLSSAVAPSVDALLADMGRGLVVTALLGSAVNPTTGDYSRGAAGFWVEGGRIAHPVNECTIAGNLREMLMTLIAADDLPEWRSHRVPSLLVGGMTVAGA